MKSAIKILRGEQGVIRVFAVSRPMADMARALKQQPKKALAATLLNQPVSDDDFELFALSDLSGVGLPRYLSDGYDVDRDALHRDRARLEALDGYVLLLFSRVSDEGDITLAPAADLTLIGSYAEPKARHAAAPIRTASAKQQPGKGSAATGRSRAGSILTGVTALLLLLLIWWIFT